MDFEKIFQVLVSEPSIFYLPGRGGGGADFIADEIFDKGFQIQSDILPW